MTMSSKIKALCAACACLFAANSSQAGIDISVDLEIGIGRELEPSLAEDGQGGGPPPWAPAHGRRAKATYHYYPEHGVYRNAETGVWFVFRDGEWTAGARLPATIRIGSGSAFVTLGMESETPYRYHAEVSNAYPISVAIQAGSVSRTPPAPPTKSGKKVPPGQAKKNR